MTDSEKLDFCSGSIWISPQASGKEVQAARELQRYLYSISQTKLSIHELTAGPPAGRPAITVGTVKSLSKMVKEFPKEAAKLKTGSDEVFDLFIGMHKGAPLALILANEPIGALYGAYTFLEKFGIGFYLGGDALPGSRVPLQLPEMDEFWNPALPIRGCVSWFNFLNGPMTWDLEDYRYFFDQMVKMKTNLVSFPEYGYGFTAYASHNKPTPGRQSPYVSPFRPLATSKSYRKWGTVRGMMTSEFGFGTGEFFTAPVFGSKASTEAADDQDTIRRAQELMAQAVAYARERGIKIGLGFQLDGTPDEAHLEDVAARLRVLVTKYPGVDYIWFWQREGAWGDPGAALAGSAIPDLLKKSVSHFAYLNHEGRALEGARMAVYIQQACSALKALAPEKRVVISGWGGDKWQHFTDLFPGLDEVLPKDIIFSALDNIDPSWEPTVSEFYGKLPADRERWAIPWWESDGGGTRQSQFMPQCNTKPFSVLLPDVLQKGCTGVLGIHWRTREVEDVARYMADFAWNPSQMSYQAFWLDFATRCFGADDAAEMSALLMELDALGSALDGWAGQAECERFTWMHGGQAPKEANLQMLREVRAKLQVVAERDCVAGRRQFLDRLERLINTIDWVTLYDDAAVKIEQAQAVDNAQEAAKLLAEAPLGKAMQAFTKLLYTQSDWGVLATVNVKAYAAYENACKERGGACPAGATAVEAPFQIAFKEPSCLLPEGKPIEVQAIVTGGAVVDSVTLHYRAMGEGAFVATPMTRGFRNVYQGIIPAPAVTEKGVEYLIEAKNMQGEALRAPTGRPAITVTIVGA